MRKTLSALFIAAILAGCGGSDSKKSPPPPSGGTGGSGGTEVSGDVLAPPAGLAVFEVQNPFQVVLGFLIPEAAAAITGLEPVGGATVELIRIDDTGSQVGSVIAQTTTSTTGGYTLTVPAGVNLSGDLVVRITGSGSQMRAQVVDQNLDITPVTEFVLQRFIDHGADLANLTTASILKLSGQVEEFDLTVGAGTSLSTMLANLQQEVGDFVDSSISTIIAQPGDASSFAGSYAQVSFEWGIHDNDGQGYSGHEVGTWLSPITFAAGAAGEVDLELTGEESADALLMRTGPGQYQLRYHSEVDAFEESIAANISSDGILSVEFPFEEDIDGDYGFRSPPGIFRVQKAANADVFVGLADSALVRYQTTDTDGDGTKDAVDPNLRNGDEVFRGLEFFVKRPSNATAGDLTGKFGRVYIGSSLYATGFRAVESEQNVMTFDGAGSVDISSATRYTVERQANGTVTTLNEVALAEPGLSYSVNADGSTDLGNGSLNDTFNFFALSDMDSFEDPAGDATDEFVDDASHSLTLGLKLPSEILNIADKVYRVLGVETAFQNDGEIAVHTTRFASLLTMTSQTTGSLEASLSDLILPAEGADLVVENEVVSDQAVQVSVGTEGALTISMPDGDGNFIMQGFLNQDGSMAILQTRYEPTSGQPNALGVAVLLEVN